MFRLLVSRVLRLPSRAAPRPPRLAGACRAQVALAAHPKEAEEEAVGAERAAGLLAFSRLLQLFVDTCRLGGEEGGAMMALLRSGRPLRAKHAGAVKRAFRTLRDQPHGPRLFQTLPAPLLAAAAAWLGALPASALGWRGADVSRALERLRGAEAGAAGEPGALLVTAGHLLLAAACVRSAAARTPDSAAVTAALAEALLAAEAALRLEGRAAPPPPPPPPAAIGAARRLLSGAPLSAGPERPALFAPAWWPDELEAAEEGPPLAPPAAPRLAQLRFALADWHAAADRRLLAARPAEARALAALRAQLQPAFPGARLLLFGSRAAGLQLPGADADLLLLLRPAGDGGEHRRERALGALRRARSLLEASRQVRPGSSVLLARARVPLLRFATAEARVACDLCCHAPGAAAAEGDEGAEAAGAAAAEWARQQARAQPQLRPLLLALKALVGGAGLGDASTGGLGGHALLCIALAYLRLEGARPGRCPAGHLLACLRWAGETVDWRAAALGVGPRLVPLPQAWAAAPQARRGEGERPLRLHIQDPVRPAFDVGAPAYNAPAARALFRAAHRRLAEGEGEAATLLRSLLPLADAGVGQVEEQRRPWDAVPKRGVGKKPLWERRGQRAAAAGGGGKALGAS